MSQRSLAPPQSTNDEIVYEFLESHNIAYERCDHPPIFTCDQAEELVPWLNGARTKNLFLRDRKGKRHFLVVARPDQTVDLKALSEEIDSSRLSMASPERLLQHLGIEPGSVSVLALLHNTSNAVEVIIDESVWSSDNVLCHPMINTSTLVISLDALRILFGITGHRYSVLALPEREVS